MAFSTVVSKLSDIEGDTQRQRMTGQHQRQKRAAAVQHTLLQPHNESKMSDDQRRQYQPIQCWGVEELKHLESAVASSCDCQPVT